MPRSGSTLVLSLALGSVAALAAAARAEAPMLPQVNVSRAPGNQAEVAVAVDPSNPRVLFAASNSSGGTRAYGSVDGGATWSTTVPVPTKRGCVDVGDPAPAIAPDGRQLLATLVLGCKRAGGVSLVVSRRDGSIGRWSTKEVSPSSRFFNDKPALAVDTTATSPYRGRVYLAWSRAPRGPPLQVVLTHSDDGGVTWSPAVTVAKTTPTSPGQLFAGLGIAATGVVYVVWADQFRDLFAARSADGGQTFDPPLHVASAVAPPPTDAFCSGLGAPIPAQPFRCVTPTPVVVPLPDSVVVTYSAGVRQLDVYAAVLDPLLRTRTALRQVNPADGPYGSDQFLPASAYDASTGRLWTCFYDTRLDRRRVRARYSCTASGDGGLTWTAPLPVAAVASDEVHRPALSAFGFGDYEGLAVAAGVAHPIWTDSRLLKSRGEEIFTTTLTAQDLVSIGR
ncbi:MAG TPA: sialidase family protein [Gaiellaceae bacterium]